MYREERHTFHNLSQKPSIFKPYFKADVKRNPHFITIKQQACLPPLSHLFPRFHESTLSREEEHRSETFHNVRKADGISQ